MSGSSSSTSAEEAKLALGVSSLDEPVVSQCGVAHMREGVEATVAALEVAASSPDVPALPPLCTSYHCHDPHCRVPHTSFLSRRWRPRVLRLQRGRHVHGNCPWARYGLIPPTSWSPLRPGGRFAAVLRLRRAERGGLRVRARAAAVGQLGLNHVRGRLERWHEHRRVQETTVHGTGAASDLV